MKAEGAKARRAERGAWRAKRAGLELAYYTSVVETLKLAGTRSVHLNAKIKNF